MSKLASQTFVSGATATRERVAPGVERQILGFDDRIMLVRVWFDVDAVGTVHRHEHSQTTYVESGEFEFTVGDETRQVTAGDCVYIAPNVDHGACCTRAGVLLDVFSPAREDFLDKEDS